MILVLVNSTLRQAFPALHCWLRRTAYSLFFNSPTRICPALPRKLNNRRVWVHPLFLTTPLDIKPHLRCWLNACLHPGDTFFDVGADVGWHAIYAARIVGREGRVVAFEASPANARFLEFHRRKNSLSQMDIVTATVADRVDANRSVAHPHVPATNLDSHAGCGAPDLVKIDMAGAELLILSGAEGIFSQRRPPLLLAVQQAWITGGAQHKALVKWLDKYDYEIFDTSGKVVTSIDFSDYLCLPREQLRTRRRPENRT